MSPWRHSLRWWRACVLLGVLEQCGAWAISHATASALTTPLAGHPDGASALASEGGRLALDVLVQHPESVRTAALTLALGAALYALILAPLRAFWAAAATAPRDEGFALVLLRALGRAPAALGLGVLELVLHGAAGWLGYAMARRAWPVARAMPQLTHAAGTLVLACVPAVLLAWLVAVLFDGALVALASGSGALRALGASAGGLRRRPVGTIARALSLGAVRVVLALVVGRVAVSAAPWYAVTAAGLGAAVLVRAVRLAWLRWVALGLGSPT